MTPRAATISRTSSTTASRPSPTRSSPASRSTVKQLADWFKVFGKAKKVKESAEAESPEALEQEAEEIAPFVIAVPPGTGKTQQMKAAVDDKTLYIDGGKQRR
jgi:hypothetical protein